MSNYKVVLFDLDGTLIDTSLGIFNSVRYAEKMMSFPSLPQDKLNTFIGPPPVKSYIDNYCVSQEMAVEATKFHRQYGSEKGIYEANVYEGIENLLIQLKSQGILLGVCTLKRQDIAEKILKHFNLFDFFDVIIGIDQQESLSKADTINIALNKLNVTSRDKVVLVGDSLYDAEGAKDTFIDFIGVLYGFGFKEENLSKLKTVENTNILSSFLL